MLTRMMTKMAGMTITAMTFEVGCCATCKRYAPIIKYDYSKGGCKHTEMDGYACLLDLSQYTTDKPKVIWMVGSDASREMCECYESRRTD